MLRELLVGVVLVGLVGYGGVAGHLYWAQSGMVFHPRQGLDATPEQWGMRFGEVVFDSQGHRIHGWWIPGDPEKPVVLFFHGNASVISGLRGHAELFRRLGLGILLFDYRGYGESTGEPGELEVYADSEAAYRYLTEVLGVSAQKIIYYGHSLGGGAATWLAVRHPARALILEGTFQSIPAVGQELYPYLPIQWLSRIHFDNLARIGLVRMPVLIIHSRDDEVIPVHHGRILFDALRAPKNFLETTGGHNTSVSKGGRVVEQGIERFLTSVDPLAGR